MYKATVISRGKISASLSFTDLQKGLDWLNSTFPEAKFVRNEYKVDILKSGNEPINILLHT